MGGGGGGGGNRTDCSLVAIAVSVSSAIVFYAHAYTAVSESICRVRPLHPSGGSHTSASLNTCI